LTINFDCSILKSWLRESQPNKQTCGLVSKPEKKMERTVVCLQRKDRIKRGGRIISQLKRIVYEVNNDDLRLFEKWYQEHNWERMFFEFPTNAGIKCEMVNNRLEKITANKIASGWLDIGYGDEINWH
jgi:hypothetical protein